VVSSQEGVRLAGLPDERNRQLAPVSNLGLFAGGADVDRVAVYVADSRLRPGRHARGRQRRLLMMTERYTSRFAGLARWSKRFFEYLGRIAQKTELEACPPRPPILYGLLKINSNGLIRASCSHIASAADSTFGSGCHREHLLAKQRPRQRNPQIQAHHPPGAWKSRLEAIWKQLRNQQINPKSALQQYLVQTKVVERRLVIVEIPVARTKVADVGWSTSSRPPGRRR
jgi:hypothetical protein